ncbi:MAG: DUF373 family protein [archaeon GB-1867-005]|nr:DUF373 family protein [Candidatus Culexmicrobium cathedralense]
MSEGEAQKMNKVLILCVDRDNDVGMVTGAKSPILGRNENLRAATEFALKAPEDSDVNAIFAAIGLYDELKKEGIECEIATITGLAEGGLKADMKIIGELNQVLEKFPADGVILVTDGAADEVVIPVIQSRIPILSVKRVLVQQQRGVEETYILIARYLRRILEEPQYAKMFLGVPGVIFLLLAALTIAGYGQYTTLGALIVIGAAFVIRGFSMDKIIMRWWASSPIIFFTGFITLIACSVAVYEGVNRVVSEMQANPALISSIPKMAGFFLGQATDIFLVGIGILLTGRMIDKYLREKPKLWHDFVGLMFLGTIRPVLQNVSYILTTPGSSHEALIYSLIITAGICSSLIVTFTLIDKIKERRGRGGSTQNEQQG